MKTCPECKKLNPDKSEKCDCGYEFTDTELYESDNPPGKGAVSFLKFIAVANLIIGIIAGIMLFPIAMSLSVGLVIESILFCPVLLVFASIAENLIWLRKHFTDTSTIETD